MEKPKRFLRITSRERKPCFFTANYCWAMLGNVPEVWTINMAKHAKPTLLAPAEKMKHSAVCAATVRPKALNLCLITRVIQAAVSHILGLCKFFPAHGGKARERRAKINSVEYEGNRGRKEKEKKKCWTESEKCVGLSAWAGCLRRHRWEFITRDKLYCSSIPLSLVYVCVWLYLQAANIYAHRVCTCMCIIGHFMCAGPRHTWLPLRLHCIMTNNYTTDCLNIYIVQ